MTMKSFKDPDDGGISKKGKYSVNGILSDIPSCRWRSSPILAFHRGELGILERGEQGQERFLQWFQVAIEWDAHAPRLENGWFIPGLAIGFAVPAFAQEKAATPAVPNPFQPIPAGPALVQQLEAINDRFDEASNKHDAAAVAALYTANATLVTPLGIFSDRNAIEKYFTDVFQRYNPSDHSTKINYVYAFGGDLCAIGGWTLTVNGSQRGGGYLINVYTPVRDTWKIRASVFKYATNP